ncbi:hypothetical protein M409DRAFT_63634 [Zasmidium cellare ATCC 36951]|uniref:Glutamine amidotransferase type-2 domain-containing protein n=1 Tax=Zasmidium cellare ATCC 36951 TaxID=1080233 RepID=A0A6A6CW04_ZASCE|nr:uncharacterized protein M409DRAFT_63634 [Zasmidium cellare ATCC 36951]KAF2171291.1 hypothetical protein M409DRAFT_63634 [Zasmidium cellare ATCC 36951]
MCGIFCSVSRHCHILPSREVQGLLDARGPDASNVVYISPEDSPDGVPGAFTTLCSTVLSLRGQVTVSQPFRRSSSGSTICWNGEAWSIAGAQPDGNDTAHVFDILEKAARQPVPVMDAHEELLYATQSISRAISQVAGPYAFVFHHAVSHRLFFGRDFLGRRSLLHRITEEGDLLLSSVTDGTIDNSWSEVEADGVYCIDLSKRSYSRDTHEDAFHKWGEHFVANAPHTVIPQLSLNREIAKAPEHLTEQSPSVSRLEKLLIDSLRPRVQAIPDPPNRPGTDTALTRARLAILFSGGLDCTVLARLTHDLLPVSEPIDLLNVAFENPRVHKAKGEASYELCPDRITARASYAELCSVCPDREWRLVAINIPYSETQNHRQQVITLMHPHNTEMDLSIAYALYFAARGTGHLEVEGKSQTAQYTTSARVLLSGLGADELFAGYTRHATAYNRNGFPGLLDELDLDIGRLGKRNLGRDDRVISHWSREVRFPFLDEDIVGWALSITVTDKCDFGAVATDDGDQSDADGSKHIEHGKKVLRCLALRLGMKQVAKEKKRAIQFGARTAKMETGKTKGTTLLS